MGLLLDGRHSVAAGAYVPNSHYRGTSARVGMRSRSVSVKPARARICWIIAFLTRPYSSMVSQS